MLARTLVRLRPLRRAFTLVEMLIAMALTLILVYAIAEFYAYVGDSVKDGRAMIEMSGHLRGVAQRLRSDLEMLTCPVVPPVDDGGAPGYFEYFEGGASDVDANGNLTLDSTEVAVFDAVNATTMLGDCDDILAFTIRTAGEPFVGRRYNPNSGNYDMLASSVAEVVWFTSFTDRDGDDTWDVEEPRFLHRRLLLMRPDLPALAMPAGETNPFYHNDISAHQTASGWVPNTLADLSRRENRFAHNQGAAAFPNALLLNPGNRASLNTWTLQNDFVGEDVVLSNLLAFDVRLYDPTAPLFADDAANPRTALQPGDVGYATVSGGTQIGQGAYVDLYYNRYAAGNSQFSAAPAAGAGAIGATYDTWATSYERDGVDQFTDMSMDLATNGLDDNNSNGVDDASERETSPPYPHPLRGIEVKVRVYEPSTRQVRQATVAGDFLPE